MVWSLLKAEGLLYDLERHVIVGLKPRTAVLPVLALGLEATSMWQQREDSLWLREDYLPPKLDRGHPHLPSHPPALTLAQQEQAIMLIRQGMSLRKIAELLETSHESVRRFLKDQGFTMQPSMQKLTDEQLEEAYALLRADVSFREVVAMFGISDASLVRLAKRDGVVLRSRGEKLTPTQRRLTTEQLQEARELVEVGESLRQTAKLFGISRSALIRILKDGAEGGGQSGEE